MHLLNGQVNKQIGQVKWLVMDAIQKMEIHFAQYNYHSYVLSTIRNLTDHSIFINQHQPHIKKEKMLSITHGLAEYLLLPIKLEA